ncbi:unnamed protein product [Soboliphyme baturini]|uniref:Uncharacterized protein n=1 Tax=Soboliphyme baturini TaxID=241478 RepID=A0A183IHI4_9BILA|nr:unnamed protein product [Soboliphyme baturini]
MLSHDDAEENCCPRVSNRNRHRRLSALDPRVVPDQVEVGERSSIDDKSTSEAWCSSSPCSEEYCLSTSGPLYAAEQKKPVRFRRGKRATAVGSNGDALYEGSHSVAAPPSRSRWRMVGL